MKGYMSHLLIGNYCQIPPDSSDLPPAAPAPHLLSLPTELFDIICSHLIPSKPPLFNRFRDVELERRFFVPERALCKDLISLAVTSKSGYQQCAAFFQPKSLVVDIGWAGSNALYAQRSKQSGTFDEDLKTFHRYATEQDVRYAYDRPSYLLKYLSNIVYRFMDIAMGRGLAAFTVTHRELLAQAIRSNPKLQGIRYLGHQQQLPFFQSLPKSLEYLEINYSGGRAAFVPTIEPVEDALDTGCHDPDQTQTFEPIAVGTLVLSDRRLSRDKGLAEEGDCLPMLWDQYSGDLEGFETILQSIAGVKKLILRINQYGEGEEVQGKFPPKECLVTLSDRMQEHDTFDNLQELVFEFFETDTMGLRSEGEPGHDFYMVSAAISDLLQRTRRI